MTTDDLFVEEATSQGKLVVKIKPKNIPAGKGWPVIVHEIGDEIEGTYGPYLYAKITDMKTGKTYDHIMINRSLRGTGFVNDAPRALIDYLQSEDFKPYFGKEVNLVRFEKEHSKKKGLIFSTYWIGPAGGYPKQAESTSG